MPEQAGSGSGTSEIRSGTSFWQIPFLTRQGKTFVLTYSVHKVLPDWAVLNLIVLVNIGLGGWTKFGLVFGQFGDFQNI